MGMKTPRRSTNAAMTSSAARLNQALFGALYIDEEVSGGVRVSHKLREPFDTLHMAQSQQQASTGPPEAAPSLRAVLLAHKRQSALPSRGRALPCN
jgi:hypothetical protein